MSQADIFYRAFLKYRSETENNAKCQKLRQAISAASVETDKLEAIRSQCIIEEDWVNRIYEGLPFVEKAIREERQFIRQQGEVVPIEKARRVSKNSVEHLARHSDMITHEPPEGEDLVPDKLYVVERLSDFAVYENKFLYMLLCYLKDFIDIRYTKIVELGNTYRAKMTMDKTVKLGKRQMSFKLDFYEEAKDDPFDFFVGEADSLMKKIEEERHLISAFLQTPLMRTVSKSPIIKPPITRTNALRMDNNFKNALALYDYIAAYNGDGYRIETYKKTYGPFPEKMGDEFSEIVSLTSFMTYEYGKELKKTLRDAYDLEEERRRREAEQRQLRRIAELKLKLQSGEISAEEYILELESRNRDLESVREKLYAAEENIAGLEANIREQMKKNNELRDEIDVLTGEITRKNEEIHRTVTECEEKLDEMRTQCDAEKESLRLECEEQLRREAERFKEEKQSFFEEVKAERDKAVKEAKDAAEKARTEAAESIKEIKESSQAAVSAANAERDECRTRLQEMETERVMLKAELHANKQMNGSIVNEEDFTSRERFSELEKEYYALKTLIEAEWKKTKKKIRKKLLWSKPEQASDAEAPIAPKEQEAPVAEEPITGEAPRNDSIGAPEPQAEEIPETVDQPAEAPAEEPVKAEDETANATAENIGDGE